jgi:FkbM family methyltransferase
MTQKRSWKDELNELLSEDISTVIEQEKTAFDRLVNPFGKSLVLFGAGKLGKQALAQLRQDGIEPLAFADNNPAVWDKFVDGVRVFSPAKAAEKFGRRAAFVVTIWSPNSHHQFAETKKNLQALNCTKVISFLPLMWKYSGRFLPNCYVDLPHKIYLEGKDVMEVYDFWEDDESRKTYLTQLKWRMLEEFDTLPACNSETQYFPASIIRLSDDEVFIDCGAYNGDTIKQFLAITKDNFKHIHAFEPDLLNFQELSNYLKDLALKERISLHQKAVGSQIEKLKFSTTGTASSIVSASGDVEIESVPLDNALKEMKPTFIKMDIEGAEVDALIGAKNNIQQAHPTLAICVYHKQDHLWKIPLLVKTYFSDYHLFLRAHQEEGWDLVCYAIPVNKIKV